MNNSRKEITYTVVLYYTEEQLKNLEQTTGLTRSGLYLYHIKTGAVATARVRTWKEYLPPMYP